MLFHTNPNVKSICHRIGVANVCFSTGFAFQGTSKKLAKKQTVCVKREKTAYLQVPAV